METLKQNRQKKIKNKVEIYFLSKSNVFRYIGNILLLSGYFVLLWGDPKTGLLVKCIGNVFVIPFAIKYKFWDILVICAFYASIEIPKLIQLFLS